LDVKLLALRQFEAGSVELWVLLAASTIRIIVRKWRQVRLLRGMSTKSLRNSITALTQIMDQHIDNGPMSQGLRVAEANAYLSGWDT
jgi:hypothetical protein